MGYDEYDEFGVGYSILDLKNDVIKTLVRREVSVLFVTNKHLQPFMQRLVCEMADVEFYKIEYNELTDRDLLQLATDHIQIRIPKTKKTGTEIENYYAKDVVERYSVSPKEFIDVNLDGVCDVNDARLILRKAIMQEAQAIA